MRYFTVLALHRKPLDHHHIATYFNVQSQKLKDSMFLKINEKTRMVFCMCAMRIEVFCIHNLQKIRACWQRLMTKVVKKIQTHRNNATLVQRNAVEGVCRQVTQSLYSCALHPVVALVKEVHKRCHCAETTKFKTVLSPAAAVSYC